MMQEKQPPSTWPHAVEARVSDLCGKITQIDARYGLSHNHVWRIGGTRQTIIVKSSQQHAEGRFYQQVAPQLHAQGVHTPNLLGYLSDAGQAWLFLEFVPNALPRDRWLAAPDVLTQLRHLHQADVAVTLRDGYRPKWTSEMTDVALNYLDRSIAPLLQRYAAKAEPLFAARHWISADPNPTNWGVRDNGDVVLFDWERFTRGTAPVDLAITVPGLGTSADYELVLNRYADKAVADQLYWPEQLVTAKIWSVVEFLCNVAAGKVANRTGVAHLVEYFPKWLRQIDQDL